MRAYLRRQRGLAESTIAHCTRFMERFLAFRFGDKLGDLNAITPDDIVAFLCKLKAGSKPRRYKALPSHLRSLFKFLFWSGKTRRNLAHSLPRVATNTDHLPRYLKPEEIQRLIEAVRTDDAIGRRNYAMLLLMARLGLRAPEVIAIQLDDIDWRAGEILIRGKGKLHDRMPLPATWAKRSSITSETDERRLSCVVRLGEDAAPSPFKDAQIVNTVLGDAFERDRPEAAAEVRRLASAAPQSRYRHAPQGSVARRDRRRAAPSLAHDDDHLRQIRPRCVAVDRTAMADWRRRSMTPLTVRLKHYIAVRRSLGYDLSFSERVLRRFTEFADSERADHITVDLFLRWKEHYGSANNYTWSRRLSMVRVFASWLQGFDPRTEVPPPGLISSKPRRTRPYIYSDDQIAAIVAEARRLPSSYGLRGWTCSTLFGLIAVTGLRVSEAIGLDDKDVDLDRSRAVRQAR